MQKITPFLWFDNQAEEAAKFYVSVFKQGKIVAVSHYTEGSPGPVGSVMVVEFEIFGQRLTALNGGPMFKFTEAISLVVNCTTQREVDYYWAKLSAGGKKSMCGWLKDKYGLSWQIVPVEAIKLLSGKDRAKATRVMQAVMQMQRIDLKKIRAAAKAKVEWHGLSSP